MTDDQVQALLEFVDPSLLGIEPDITLQVSFAFKQEGEEEDTTVELPALIAYFQEHYGVSEGEGGTIMKYFERCMDNVYALTNESVEYALFEAVRGAITEKKA
jgi:hypothetical protein